MAKKLSGHEQKASLKALMDYRGEAQRLMKDKMNGLKKKPEHKKDGMPSMEAAFEEAEDLLDSNDEDSDLEEYTDEITDGEFEDEKELDEKIAELMARKNKLKSMK